jgi:hypothetical protein
MVGWLSERFILRKAFTFRRFRVIHDMSRAERGQRKTKMTIFTIDNENSITAFATAEAAAAASTTPFDLFTSQKELAELLAGWPAERLVATWNSLPGVVALKSLPETKAGRGTWAKRIWERAEKLGQMVSTEAPAAKKEAAKPAGPPAKGKAAGKAKAGAKPAKGAPVKAETSKKTSPAKAAPKGKKGAQPPAADAPREGSKMAQVIAMMERKNGTTIEEIMEAMGWLRHTVRGFVAGAMKKAGYQVESFRPEGGSRTYRLSK